MIAEISPGLILILGAFAVPLLPARLRAAYLVLLPVVAFLALLTVPQGNLGQVQLLDLTLMTLRVDKLSLLFGYVFLIAALIGFIYALHLRDPVQQVAGAVYAGAALGAVFAGDLVTFFIFWEGTAIASVFLIWASRTERAYKAGLRYLVWQVGSGLLLLAGVAIHYRATGSLAFDKIGIDSLAGKLILLAIGIKCAFPLLHNWLQDAYPEATVSGTVLLSAFTTKLAVYALARGYAGTEILVPIGAVMAVFPLLHAVVEDDLRRSLAYGLNSQLGFMVAGVGIGTELALGGAVAHAVCSILYQALLFMAVGAVLFRTGTARASELGGLYRSMPWTAGACVVGAASISAVPLFSGFVSKGLTIGAAMESGYFWAWIVLLMAGAGTFLQFGLKLPFAVFFGRDSGKRPAEAPLDMRLAMVITATLCVLIGLYPWPLYALLPHPVGYAPYTIEHVVTQLQLLILSALAFTLLMRTGLYPPELRSTNLDTDWFYRVPGHGAVAQLYGFADRLWTVYAQGVARDAQKFAGAVYRATGPTGAMARGWPTGLMVFWTTVLLAAFLVLSYL